MRPTARLCLGIGSVFRGLCFAIVLLVAASGAPSARRVWLLCEMEDPQCGPSLAAAYADFLANPTWTTTIAGSERPTTFVCHTTRRVELKELYPWFMRSVGSQPLVWPEPARLGVYAALNDAGMCR
jgi:hypothetical protein